MAKTKKKLPRWQKIVMILLGVTTALMLLFDYVLFNGIYIAPYRVTSQFVQLKSPKIPQSLNQLSIIYLSDIEYGSNFPTSKGQELFDEIVRLDPDVLLIGGDLFCGSESVTNSMREQMAKWLSSVPAPNGKFAVYGEQDLVDSDHSIAVDDVYYKSEVEVLDNESVLLSNRSRSGIRLGGLSLTADPQAAAASVSSDQYFLLMSHYPDNLLAVQDASITPDLALCGNSHGTQIDWPILGGYRIFEGSQQINRSRQPRLAFPYTITSGVGCIDIDARINAPVQFIHYTLISEADQNTPASSAPASMTEQASSAAQPQSEAAQDPAAADPLQEQQGQDDAAIADQPAAEDPAVQEQPVQ